MEKLSPEQIKELNEIARLPREEQQARLQEFLSTLSEEQIEFLKSQQEQSCPFCSIIFGGVTSNKIYEDDKIMAVLDINPANVGHFITFPKEHIKNSFEMKPESLMYLISVSNLLAKKMQIVVKSDGFNILISNGLIAGQRSEHFIVHCIPRFKEDEINFIWKPKMMDESIINNIIKEFSNFKAYNERKVVGEERKSDEVYYEEDRIP
ncbi:HIT family protein [Candidatus Woesearchaeota archaeon]|nr:HIT family protein [Candidatus Woesearchaeota archaeon]